MPRDPFARVRPGDVLPGLPAPPWNGLLDLLDEKGLGPKGGGGREDGAVEFRVKNTTGTAVDPFGLLQVNASLNDTTALNLFKFEDVLQGTTPAADKPFVVYQEPVKAGGVGRARILGVTTALVNVTDSSHNYAAPTTATDKLTSGTSGPARIIVKDSGTGDKWCKVLLLGQSQPAAGGPVYVSAFDTGGLTTPGSATLTTGASGLGLYAIYCFVSGKIQSTASNDLVQIQFQPTITPGTGVTVHRLGVDFLGNTMAYVCKGLFEAAGSTSFTGLIEVASPATATGTVSISWTGAGTGLGTLNRDFRAEGWIVRLRADS